MSVSPVPPTAVPSQKRPLEDPSSESGLGEQPEAKRPALGTTRDGPANENHDSPSGSAGKNAATDGVDSVETVKNDNAPEEAPAKAETNGAAVDGGDAIEASAALILETQPIQSTASGHDNASSQGPFPAQHQDETGWLHMRAIISSAEAATIIGKGGENVSLIRRMSGAKCTVSEYSRGAVERILTVSGLVDAAAKAFGLIIRTLNNESLEAASSAQSKTYPLRLLIPHILVGSIIGQKGVRIREIQEASGARLNASEGCLPLSTERSLVVLGVADAVHIATYYVGSTLMDQLTERFGGPAASAYATRSGAAAGVVPGGMQVVPYVPQSVAGQWGAPDNYRRHPTQQTQQRPAANPSFGGGHFQQPPVQQRPPTGGPFHQPAGQHFPGQGPPLQPGHPGIMHPPIAPVPGPGGAAMPGQPLTQQIFIPNDMVGAIIGKGGAKINEIRQLSGCSIKINEPQDNSNERLVTITGTQECNAMALYMLYQRLESEKHRI